VNDNNVIVAILAKTIITTIFDFDWYDSGRSVYIYISLLMS
jgi:hypothetical protein